MNQGYPDSVWEAVQAMWMAGNSAHSIANKEGMPSKQAICDRVKSDGWERVDKPDESMAVIPFDNLSHEQRIAVTKIAEGLTQKAAAAFAGVSRETVTRWMKDDAFLTAREAAIAVKAARRVKRIEDAEDWRAATWLLERDPDSRTDYGAPKAAPPVLPHMMFNILGQVQVGLERQIEQQPITVEGQSEPA